MAEGIPILLVDDQEEARLSLGELLARQGYRVVTAASGAQALKAALQHDFALVVLDVVMPEMDGVEVAGYLKLLEQTRNIPIIFLTALTQDLDCAAAAYSVGGADVLSKPVNPLELRAKVSQLTGLSARNRLLRSQLEQASSDLELARTELERLRRQARQGAKPANPWP
jgi:CheY-like chemotaxis protein